MGMECRSILLLLVVVSVLAMQTVDGNVVPNESMQEVVERLIQKTAQLEKSNQNLATKTAQLEKKNRDMGAEMTTLRSEISHLKTGKIKQSLLPGGYSDF